LAAWSKSTPTTAAVRIKSTCMGRQSCFCIGLGTPCGDTSFQTSYILWLHPHLSYYNVLCCECLAICPVFVLGHGKAAHVPSRIYTFLRLLPCSDLGQSGKLQYILCNRFNKPQVLNMRAVHLLSLRGPNVLILPLWPMVTVLRILT
jgi:hypothetical protein